VSSEGVDILSKTGVGDRRVVDDTAEAILAEILRSETPDVLYQHYGALRTQAPLFWSPSHDSWVASTYAVVSEVFRHPDGVLDEHAAAAFRAGADGPWYDMWCRMMLFLDPAGHVRIRRLVNRMFTKRAVERLRPVSQDVVDRLLGRLGDRREMEVIGDFAYELPIAVIAGLCDLPEGDVPTLLHLAHDFAKRANPAGITEDSVHRGDAAAVTLGEYFQEKLASHESGGDDMLSALAAGGREAEVAEPDLIANAVLLFMAGHETTANLIGNAVAALLEHPDQLALVRDQPDVIAGAVEEFLRFDPPLHGDFRTFPRGAEIGGTAVLPGDRVMLLLASANHDPERWDEPDRLDVRRDASEHWSFGWGAYYCLGAALARVQSQVAIQTLVQRFPGLRLVEAPVWHPTLFGRGPVELKVRW
jgi:cytochrome P450